MRVLVDITEPGLLFQMLRSRSQDRALDVQRSMLHKREGLGGSARARHPFYGTGADYVITDDAGRACAAIERKSLEDLARSVTLDEPRGPRIFRQLRDLALHPMPILLLEGQASALYRRVEPAVLGLQLWCAREGISIVYSRSIMSTPTVIVLLAQKLAEDLDVRDLDEEPYRPPGSAAAGPSGRAPSSAKRRPP